MLRVEPGRRYVVYPSWAEGQLPCSWVELPAELADPEKSRFLDQNDRIFLEGSRGLYPATTPTSTYQDGPWGGGIVVTEADPHPQRWLADLVLSRIAGRRYPAMMLHPPGYTLPVGYLEPIPDAARGYSFLGKAPQLYPTIITVEHAERAGDDIHLVVMSKSARSPLPGARELVEGYHAFGLALSPVSEIASALDEEVTLWGGKVPNLVRSWYRLDEATEGIGFLAAVTIYVALHLRRLAGHRMFSVHLVADIEGRPNFMRHAGGVTT